MWTSRILGLTLLIGTFSTAATADEIASAGTPTTKVVPIGYVEAYYAYNFARPSNGITNFRGYDNRHNTFSITNAVLGAGWESGDVSGRVVFQVGSTASSEYLNEPALPGTASVNTSGPDLWKFIQEASVGYQVPGIHGFSLRAGIFLAPVGPEVLAVKDNWNWSRSNLFFGLWSYETGARATYEVNEAWSLGLGVFNGWNSVVDNNTYKSIQAIVAFRPSSRLNAQFLYFGGVERPKNAPEGNPWRNTFDLYALWDTTDWLSLMAQLDAGFEPNDFGTSSWYAGAVYARVHPTSWLFATVRGDRFWEHVPTNNLGSQAAPIFWGGADWVSELTATVEIKPPGPLATFVEYRHDHAESPIYFRGGVAGLGTPLDPFIPNSTTQDTITIGATTWF